MLGPIDYCFKHQVGKVHLQTIKVNKMSGLQSRPSPLKVLLGITTYQVAKISIVEEKIYFTQHKPSGKFLRYAGNIF
jgi:hypothetical protein